MTDFFKSNPIALRHCLLYQYLQKKPVEESFQEFRKTVGDIIKRKEFGVWFIRFGNGMFSETPNNQKPQYNMMEVLLSDPKALRACILYEFLKPNRNKLSFRILAGYNHFCEVIGDDVIEYLEFDFWFYRFLNGEFDLDFKGERYQKNLLDMPIDVMKNIVEYSDIFDRIALARTSRSFQTFVSDQKLFQHTLKLNNISIETAIVSFGESNDMQYISEYLPTKKLSKRVKRVRGVSVWEQALLDLISILKYPKLHLDSLEIEFPTDDSHYEYLESPATLMNVLENALKFTHYLNVKKLILEEYSSILLIKLLPTLKPGYLTTINIRSHQESMDTVFEMEQWKQAKYFKMEGCFVWPLRHLYHFVDFEIRSMQLFVEDVRQMKEILFKSPVFKKCSLFIVFKANMHIFAQEFGNAYREDPYIYHYPILNSTDYFEIKVEGWNINYFDFEAAGSKIEITRKKS